MLNTCSSRRNVDNGQTKRLQTHRNVFTTMYLVIGKFYPSKYMTLMNNTYYVCEFAGFEGKSTGKFTESLLLIIAAIII